MNSTNRKLFIFISLTFFLLLTSKSHQAQTLSFNYYSRIEMAHATEPPELGGLPDVDFPEAARKNGVEGTLKAKMTLGENGKVRDIVITQGLPHGVDEAFMKAVQNFYFTPAKQNGQPVPVTLFLDFVVSMNYSEGDKNVSKPKITEKPAPVYPEKYRAEKLKGKVEVVVMFYKDGTMKIINVSSVMPKEFDRAAMAAAEKIKFEPAVHKKSKNPVGQAMTVVYDFKP
jgi:TonB family protein